MTVQPEDYMDKLVEYGIMKIFAICAVDETHQAWCEEDDFQVDKPPMIIEVCNKTNVYIFLEYVPNMSYLLSFQQSALGNPFFHVLKISSMKLSFLLLSWEKISFNLKFDLGALRLN